MITAKRNEFMENSTYPKSYKCVCGREAELSFKNITTKFKDTYITVENVPAYECSSQHLKMARLTRVKMNALLKNAYEKSSNHIEYK